MYLSFALPLCVLVTSGNGRAYWWVPNAAQIYSEGTVGEEIVFGVTARPG